MSSEIEIEVKRKQLNLKTAFQNCGKITRKDIDNAVKNGGIFVMKEDPRPAYANPSTSNLIGFGKYKGKSYNWLWVNDPAYMTWCFENVAGFHEKAKAANYKVK